MRGLMLTRLRVSGFKNLVDVDVRFGPFTCIAGANGVGKSNLFDAIMFLGSLADRPIGEAALLVRNELGRSGDLRSVFHRVGETYDDRMTFEADMVIPREGVDDLGQEATAAITFLRYALTLAYRTGATAATTPAIEIEREELRQINLRQAPRDLGFPHSVQWRQSAVTGRRTSPFISTEVQDGRRVVKLHQDGGPGRPLLRLAETLPRTVLSATTVAESPTALLVRREMRSWRLLHLEPVALRRPDELNAPPRLSPDGSHLAATLYHLAHSNGSQTGPDHDHDPAHAYGQVATRLADLIEDVRDVTVERDEKRELLTLVVTDANQTTHPAQALSDGTLRFLALTVVELDPTATGLICLEEPENGVHPKRIPAMLQLLADIVADTSIEVGDDNPLRQVIVNTHSPAVVSQVPGDSLLVAELRTMIIEGERSRVVSFGCLPDTWRTRSPDPPPSVARGKLLDYLSPLSAARDEDAFSRMGAILGMKAPAKRRRVIDRPDLQLPLPLGVVE